MIIPISIRCFTCNKVIADKWIPYCEEINNYYQKNNINKKEYINSNLGNNTIENDLLDKYGFTRYCCRRMIISHIDIDIS